VVDVSGFTLSLALVAGGVVVFALLRGLLHRGIRASLAAPRIRHDRTPGELGLPFEAVRIATANGHRLHAWMIAPATACGARAPAVIVMHGWGGNAAMMLPLARPLHDAGFAALYVDAQCHGASDDDSFASLPRFAEDIEHALKWLARQVSVDPARVSVIGHSVGAGAALLVASRRSDVAAIVSVAAFSHPAAIMQRWMATKRIPERPVGRYILAYVQKTIGHRFDDIAPVTTLPECDARSCSCTAPRTRSCRSPKPTPSLRRAPTGPSICASFPAITNPSGILKDTWRM
jgi:uncharacterized protein